MDLVRGNAPWLVPIIEKGPMSWLIEQVTDGLRALVDARDGAGARGHRRRSPRSRSTSPRSSTWMVEIGGQLAKGDCSGLAAAADKVHEGRRGPRVARDRQDQADRVEGRRLLHRAVGRLRRPRLGVAQEDGRARVGGDHRLRLAAVGLDRARARPDRLGLALAAAEDRHRGVGRRPGRPARVAQAQGRRGVGRRSRPSSSPTRSSSRSSPGIVAAALAGRARSSSSRPRRPG